MLEIWLTGGRGRADAPRADGRGWWPGAGLDGDRYALGGGTWARYPDLEKQLTLIDRDDVAAVAAETGADLSARRHPAQPRDDGHRPARAGRAAGSPSGDVLLFGMKRCPPCTHLERLTGVRLVKAMVHRGGINAAVFAGAEIARGRRRPAAVRRGGRPARARRPAPTARSRAASDQV